MEKKKAGALIVDRMCLRVGEGTGDEECGTSREKNQSPITVKVKTKLHG